MGYFPGRDRCEYMFGWGFFLERRKKVRGMGGNYNSTREEGDKKEE